MIQDVASYEETQETLALLKILALGNRQIEEGRVAPIADVVKRLRARRSRKSPRRRSSASGALIAAGLLDGTGRAHGGVAKCISKNT